MPTPTFFNLPKQKSQRIIDVAIDEFASAHFNDVSINQLIKRAEISRGSFYQYFENLEDLYCHITEQIAHEKLSYLHAYLEKKDASFFERLKGLYSTGLTFAMTHPKYAQIGNLLFKGDPVFKQKIFGEQEQQSKQFFIDLLQSAQNKGEIRSDINIQTAAFLFYQMNLSISDYYLTGTTWFESPEEYLIAVDEMINIFKRGVETKKGE
ncbi:TetR/AcrR family transcriptional regulator [Salipaludibacillus daqingensis]|uniref:TetR/AcrR family transcriptional regulator n=1 Tax=Salipaludibacillus daqingensis TaxID=3041001 RepID=UPI002475C67B|nr:TetR/AcrR family transcriptional regulator [Salipaludibacillus daqingensis]